MTYVEFPVDLVTNVHWKKKKPDGGPGEPPPCPPGRCDAGYHDIANQGPGMIFNGQWDYFFLQLPMDRGWTGTNWGPIPEAIVYEPRFIPPYDIPGDGQQDYIYAQCAKSIIIHLDVPAPHTGAWIAVWVRPNIHPFSLDANGDLKIWRATQVGPNTYQLHGPRYTPTEITYAQTINFDVLAFHSLPYQLPPDEGIAGITIQFQIGVDASDYGWVNEPYPSSLLTSTTSFLNKRRTLDTPYVSRIPSIDERAHITPYSTPNYFDVTIDCGDA